MNGQATVSRLCGALAELSKQSKNLFYRHCHARRRAYVQVSGEQLDLECAHRLNITDNEARNYLTEFEAPVKAIRKICTDAIAMFWRGGREIMSPNETESPQPAAPSPAGGPSRVMSNQLAIYYSNCAMVATSPRDVSLFFGRLVPTSDEKGGQTLAELYERQIYMTFEQAEDLARMLIQTAQMARARKAEAAAKQPTQEK
jgi:hypothetical protein